jgi:hypothetical protein
MSGIDGQTRRGEWEEERQLRVLLVTFHDEFGEALQSKPAL